MDDGTCWTRGCGDSTSVSYYSNTQFHDATFCSYPEMIPTVAGCMDSLSFEYDSQALVHAPQECYYPVMDGVAWSAVNRVSIWQWDRFCQQLYHDYVKRLTTNLVIQLVVGLATDPTVSSAAAAMSPASFPQPPPPMPPPTPSATPSATPYTTLVATTPTPIGAMGGDGGATPTPIVSTTPITAGARLRLRGAGGSGRKPCTYNPPDGHAGDANPGKQCSNGRRCTWCRRVFNIDDKGNPNHEGDSHAHHSVPNPNLNPPCHTGSEPDHPSYHNRWR